MIHGLENNVDEPFEYEPIDLAPLVPLRHLPEIWREKDRIVKTYEAFVFSTFFLTQSYLWSLPLRGLYEMITN